ncbi:POTRA domain-containing protein [Alistipes sp.]|uniref:POTRA domain-containing protein n=1 Tax=Alistipes sp. TaxID=1872444 RepID=UPI003AEFABDA
MYSRVCILFLTLLAAVTAFARVAGPDMHTPNEALHAPDAGLRAPDYVDTLDTRVTERNQRLYDSIESKTSRRAVPRLLYKMFFVKPRLDTTASGRVLDETRLLAPYTGKTIGEIRIEREQVFDPGGNWLERAGNKLHWLTHERVIRRDLLFKTGDRFDPDQIVRSEQLLRSRSYISDADVTVVPDSTDTTRVDLVLRTRDSWTISVDAGLRSEGRTMVGLSDDNIFGTGNRLKVMTNFSRHDFSYGGNLFQYEIPNLFGSFYGVKIEAGRSFYEETLALGLKKEFLKPTDYEVGVTYNDLRSKHYMVEQDTSEIVKVRNLDLWAGRSRYIRPLRSSFFITARYNYARFSERPAVWYGYNPALHDRDALLTGVGLYREKFLTANMVYGFGTKEYLATGYKAELVTGYSWGEFSDALYLGMGYKTGGFRSIGYIMGGFTLGSYIDHTSGMWSRSAVDIDLRWFSNLFIFRRNRIRQFLSFNYTQGWNREVGNNESIRFTDRNGLQALDEYITGTNRMVLNTETVIFAPFQPLGFRFAFFGFADFGLIGYSPNTFKNDFFTSFGIGVRIKNERLIFSRVQIRLGIAFGKHGLVASDYFRMSNGTRLEEYRYRPARPEIVGFE